mgnify:CR=1 FL=1
MEKLLLVEDDLALGQGVRLALQTEDRPVTLCRTLAQARQALEGEGPFALAILDVNLPDGSGLTFLEEVRGRLPVILLTAKSEDTDKILGLNVGADDYVTKPFNPVEVLARVKSQLRRYLQLGGGVVKPTLLQAGGIALDDRTKSVTLDGEPVALTPREYEILRLLLQHPGTVFSPKRIYRTVWGEEPYGVENAVAVHIRHLREKLEINPSAPRYIKVVWGQGYKLEGGKP